MMTENTYMVEDGNTTFIEFLTNRQIPFCLTPIKEKRFIVDVREEKLIYKLIKRNIPIKVEMLLVGDIAMGDSVIEIKRVLKGYDYRSKTAKVSNDIRASLFDNRIDQQSKDRLENYKWSGMIVEMEDGAEFFDQYFTPKHWDSLRLTLEWDFKTHIMPITKNTDETIDIILKIWEKDQQGPKAVSPCNKTPKPKTQSELQQYLLSGLINCGDEKTQFLLKLFKSPIMVFKWILETKIEFTKGGNPKDPGVLKGYGSSFFLDNQKLLWGDII
jgi:ERCC4-type nuclease